ncbi:MAG: hypothetical protein MZW92_26695 [Comamonadaceae bacterium]|nr:hypothetical protein [Comamonadaceae bacterium]
MEVARKINCNRAESIESAAAGTPDGDDGSIPEDPALRNAARASMTKGKPSQGTPAGVSPAVASVSSLAPVSVAVPSDSTRFALASRRRYSNGQRRNH